MSRSVEVDGAPWRDGWVGADADGNVWRLTFLQSDWGPVHDRWVWQAFGTEVEQPLEAVTPARVWPQELDAEIDVTPDPGLSTSVEKRSVRRRAS